MGSAKSGQQKPDGSGKDLKKEKEREKLNTNHNYVMKPRSFVRKHNSYKWKVLMHYFAIIKL